jgi:hypothetical protein
MSTYFISLSLTRPPHLGDSEVVALLRQAVQGVMCVEIEITARGMIVECEAAYLDFLETAIRVKPGAHGGSLDHMTAVNI